ncbi:MAG TPA: hypothetical protein VF746_11950 [Longimicrobium sp.]
MQSFRTSLVVLALLAAAPSLPAQSTRPYDGGRFTIELPRGITGLTLIRKVEDPASAFEGYVGGGYDVGLVMVNRTVLRGVPRHPALADSAALRRLLTDTSAARVRQLREAPVDTSAAARRAFMQAMGDTSLATRRAGLELLQSLFVRGDDWIRLEGDGREIVTEDRVARRSPVTVDLDRASLHGIADISVPRQGGLEVWMVLYAAVERTPAVEAAAARMLDSFRVKPAPADATPPE